MRKSYVTWYEKTKLNNPILVIAFEGWPDAGKTASMSAIYLIEQLRCRTLGEISPEGLFFVQNPNSENVRPQAIVRNGMVKTLKIRTTYLWQATLPDSSHDVIIALGPEPELNWHRYAEIIMELSRKLDVARIFSLGGTFAPIPHTMGTKVSAIISSEELTGEVKKHAIDLSRYQGPTSIQSLLTIESAKNSIPMISLWSHTPHYIRVVDYIGRYHLLEKLKNISGIDINLEEAKKDSDYLLSQVNNAILKKPDLQKYLGMLETEYLKVHRSGKGSVNNRIFKEIEDILRDSNL